MSGLPSYKEAISELESIVEEIESETVDVDALADKIKRAAFLITVCKEKLRKTDEDVRKILDNISVVSGVDDQD